MSAEASGETPPSPVQRGLVIPAREETITVAGCTINYRVWGGPTENPPVLLVHGVLAHGRWWDPVAGWLSEDRQVVALDLSGMGDSGRRDVYDRLLHAQEIERVTRHAGIEGAVLVAHSYGGDPAIRCCQRARGLFSRLVLLDSRLQLPDVRGYRHDNPVRKAIYASPAEAETRFKLVPESRYADADVIAHVARHSVTQEDGGWSWKFDGRVVQTETPLLDPRDLTLPIAFIRGGDSDITPPDQMEVTRAYLPGAAFLELPAAGHHLMIDQPLALVAMLRGLFARNEPPGGSMAA
jgi:pimeloyl-ACP methyl ester carboxylesterase